jgi:hypothetical protein
MATEEFPQFPNDKDPTLSAIEEIMHTLGAYTVREPSLEAAQASSTEGPEAISTATSECLGALFDLSQVARRGRRQHTGTFFEAFTRSTAPDDLYTHISTLPPGDHIKARMLGAQREVVASIVINFASWKNRQAGHMVNLDVINTPEGVQICQKEWDTLWGERVACYTRTLTVDEIRALQHDTQLSRDRIVEADMERMKMGPLEEKPDENGDRRFHVGDVLSVIVKQYLSARGPEGVYDILTHMTGERPATSQLPRFFEECTPALLARYPNLSQLHDQHFPDREIDDLEHYKLLNRLIEELGASLLGVDRIDPSQHAALDPTTEFELDYGRKLTTFNLDDEES